MMMNDSKRQSSDEIFDFHPIAREFPDNKIYAIITIEPELVRGLIKHFVLIVNNDKRDEFASTFHNISISGFDTNKDKTVHVRIQAIPINDKCRIRESKDCEFFFNGQVFSLSPMVHFEWDDEKSKPIFLIKWHHINDQSVEKYILLLDNKEIYYVNQRPFSSELEVCIRNLEPKTKHKIEIILEMKKRKHKYRSDLIHFTVPTKKDEISTDILNVRSESAPDKLLAIIEIEKEATAYVPKPDHLQKYALELLAKLQKQIEKRKYRDSQD